MLSYALVLMMVSHGGHGGGGHGAGHAGGHFFARPVMAPRLAPSPFFARPSIPARIPPMAQRRFHYGYGYGWAAPVYGTSDPCFECDVRPASAPCPSECGTWDP